MSGKSPLRYPDGCLIRLMDRAQVKLPDGRLVVGRVIRLKVRDRHVTVAVFDPVFRRCDGYPCRIRRLSLPRRFLRPLAEAA